MASNKTLFGQTFKANGTSPSFPLVGGASSLLANIVGSGAISASVKLQVSNSYLDPNSWVDMPSGSATISGTNSGSGSINFTSANARARVVVSGMTGTNASLNVGVSGVDISGGDTGSGGGGGGGNDGGLSDAQLLSQAADAALALVKPRSETWIIAAHDSVGAEKADLVCAGVTPGVGRTSDDQALNAFIRARMGQPGKFLFRTGTYELYDELVIDNSWTDFEGESSGSWGRYVQITQPRATEGKGTKLRQNTANKGVFRVGTDYSQDGGGEARHKGMKWKHFYLFGTSYTGTAFTDTGMTDRVVMDDIKIHGFANGVLCRWDDPTVTRLDIQDNSGYALRADGVRGRFNDNIFYDISENGLRISAYGSIWNSNVIGNTGQNGVLIFASAVDFSHNTIEAPGVALQQQDAIVMGSLAGIADDAMGIISGAVQGCVLIGNRINMVRERGLGGAPLGFQNTVGNGIVCGFGDNTNTTPDYSVIMGNVISHAGAQLSSGQGGAYNTSGKAIYFRNGTDHCKVIGNPIMGTAWNNGGAAVDLGTGTNNTLV